VDTVITLSASEPAQVLVQALRRGFADLERDHGLRLQVEVERAADPAVLRCRFETAAGAAGAGRDAVDLDACRRRLAGVLADFVLERMEPALLRRLLAQGYGDLHGEGERILAAAQRQLAGVEPSPLPPPAARREYLQRRISGYLEEDRHLHLDGLLTFRMGDYLDDLEAALDRAVEDVLIEREYREFLHLLRYFVETHEPRLDLVHVLIHGDGGFDFIDGDGRYLPHEEDDDMLVSALVALAPRRVLVHDPHLRAAGDVTATLRGVFPHRVHLCRGCRICRRGAGRQDR